MTTLERIPALTLPELQRELAVAVVLLSRIPSTDERDELVKLRARLADAKQQLQESHARFDHPSTRATSVDSIYEQLNPLTKRWECHSLPSGGRLQVIWRTQSIKRIVPDERTFTRGYWCAYSHGWYSNAQKLSVAGWHRVTFWQNHPVHGPRTESRVLPSSNFIIKYLKQ